MRRFSDFAHRFEDDEAGLSDDEGEVFHGQDPKLEFEFPKLDEKMISDLQAAAEADMSDQAYQKGK